MHKQEVHPVIAVALTIVVLAMVGYIFYTRAIKREEVRGAPPSSTSTSDEV